jgi:hypothetical protein
MASAINNGTFEFNPEELKDWSRVINELTFGDPSLNAVHDVQQGIKHQQQIVFAGRLGLLGKKVGANCTPNQISGITLSEKMWDPAFEDFRLEHCTTDVNQQDKLVNQMARMNPDYFTVIEGSQRGVGDFLVATILDAVKENLWFKVWFDDKLASTFEDSDGSNTFTNGTDVGYFNSFDGLFKQIESEISSISNAKYFTAITKNAGNSYANQALASGDAIAAMKSVYNKADSRLRSRTDAKFLVTRSIYDGLINDLETIQNVGGFTQTNEGGMSVLRYRGVEVVMMDVWDRFIDTYQNNGTVRVKPHRIVMTVADNIPVGTLAEGDFGTVDAFFDKYHRVNVIDGVYSLDAKFLEPYLASVAY